MRIVVFGASGATGRHIVTHGQARGLDMVAVARNPAVLPTEFRTRAAWPVLPLDQSNLQYGINGLGTDGSVKAHQETLCEILRGADAVVVALGIRRRTRSPFAPLISPKNVCSAATALIMPAMVAERVPRLLYISAYGVGQAWGSLPWWARAFIGISNVRWSYRDHAVAEAAIEKSALDWRILNPTLLTDEAGPDARPMTPADNPLRKISREGLGAYVITNITDSSLARQRVTLAA